VGRHRRSEQSAEFVLGRWHLQINGRGQNVDSHGPEGHAAHRPHRHRSRQPGRRVRRGAGTSVGIERGARGLPDDGRRLHLEEDTVRGRQHGRHGHRDGPAESEDCDRGHLPTAAQTVGVQR
jgi:hypothetical protein